MMNLINLVTHRRSCRKFAPSPIEESKIRTILNAALLAPTSKNRRPWEFIVVSDKELLTSISQSKPHGASFLDDAPMAIVIIADTQKSDVWVEDTSIAATVIQLTAEDLGLGSCWIQIRKRDHESGITASQYIKEQLHIPDNYEVASIIAIGYKAKERLPYSDTDIHKEKIHLNTFESSDNR